MAPYFNRVLENTIVEEAPHHPASQAFVNAGKELGLRHIDFQTQNAEGVGYFPLNAIGRLRQSSSITYLHPLSRLPEHLEVWTETLATKILIENGKAIGAETTRGIIHAGRAVILSCGSIQTPQLMMLSVWVQPSPTSLEFRLWPICLLWASTCVIMWQDPSCGRLMGQSRHGRFVPLKPP
jgi:hypothetical protein